MRVKSKRIIAVLSVCRLTYLYTDFDQIWIGLHWSPDIHSGRNNCGLHRYLRSLSWIHIRLICQHIRLYLRRVPFKNNYYSRKKYVQLGQVAIKVQL